METSCSCRCASRFDGFAQNRRTGAILLGGGERLFDGLGDDLHGLELVRTVAAPTVAHLKFARGVSERAWCKFAVNRPCRPLGSMRLTEDHRSDPNSPLQARRLQRKCA